MKLNQMFRNVLDFSFDALVVKVEEDSVRRTERLNQSMSKNDIAPKARTSISLSVEEKLLLKSLGLTMKDLKLLKEAQANE